MTQVVLFNVFNGLIVGAFYALMALGLSLILNLSGVINFAHGGFLALGAYLAFTLIPYVGFWGALIVAPLLTAALGLVIERVLIRPLYGGDPEDLFKVTQLVKGDQAALPVDQTGCKMEWPA